MKNSPVGWRVCFLFSLVTVLVSARAGVVTSCDEAGLRAAVAGGGVVTFACDGTITLSQTLEIGQNIALDGTGHAVTLSGGGSVQVLGVGAGVQFAMTNITIADGLIGGTGSYSTAAGGGLFNAGVSTVVDCTFSNNIAANNGGFAFGGGIYDKGTLVALNCTFVNNGCITTGAFPGSGGGIASGWEGGSGGFSGPMYITNCTFFGNTSYGGNAGGVKSLVGSGGFELNQNGPVFIVNCSFASNSTLNVAGAQYAPVTLINTVLENPSGENASIIIDGGYNLSSDTAAGLTSVTSISGVDPLLGPLAPNGGPTETMALLQDSPAIDAADDAAAPPTDQRGVNRPQGLHSDIGAYESLATGSSGILGLSQTNIQALETAGSVVFTVNRTAGSDGSATVDFATSDGTAIAGQNYVATNGQLTFEPGQLSAQFSVTALYDSAVQGNRSFNVSLNNAVGASLGTASAIVTLLDVDSGVAFSTNSVTTNISAGNATITVLRFGATNSPVSVNYATSDRTAIAGRDYSTASGVLNFAAGQASATIHVPILNNGQPGPTKSFWIGLDSPSGASLLAPSVAAVTIVNTNTARPGSLAFLNASLSVSGAVPTATVTVMRSGGADGGVSVAYAASDGTAHSPADYGATSGTLQFADQQTAASFVIPLTVESGPGQKTLNLSLSGPLGGAVLGNPATATVVISYGAQVLGGSDEIAFRNAVLGAGMVTFSSDAAITLTSTIIVPAGVMIDGSGHNVSISGGGTVGIFKLDPGVTLALKNLTLADGRAVGPTGAGPTGPPGTRGQPGGPGVGGAVADISATLIATSCVFSNNRAVGGTGGDGGGVVDEPGGPGVGGCIYNAGGQFVASNCVFIGNGAVGGAMGAGGTVGALGDNGPTAQGGALYCSNATTLLVDCIISNNFAASGQGVYGAPAGLGEGGGICVAGGSFTLISSDLVSNSCQSPSISSVLGGGVYQSSGNLLVTNSVFNGNWAQGGNAEQSRFGFSAGGYGLGGGLCVLSGTANVGSSTFVNNAAMGGWNGGALGGAVYNGGVLQALNCTLARNSALAGSAPSGPTYGSGGALFNAGLGIATLAQLTIASNTATVDGATSPYSGGVDSTNIAGMVLQNSILAFNVPQDYNGVLLDDGNNLSSDATPAFTHPGSLASTDPLLGALADNGGPTPTMALSANSPAIDQANGAFLPPFDQRGEPRPAGLAGDIGAFEYQSSASSGPSVRGTIVGLWPGDEAQIMAGAGSFWTTGGAFTVSPDSDPFVVTPVNDNYVFSPASQDVTTNQASVLFQAYHKNAFTSGALANGTVTLTLAGADGQSFVVQTSSDLVQWAAVSTNHVDGSGLTQFQIGLTGGPQLFYRAVAAP